VPNYRTLSVATRPFEHIYVDLIGPFVKSKEGFKHVCVVMDSLTHWIELIPLYDTKAVSVARAINEGVLCRHGSVSRITTDRGTEFNNHLMKALTELSRAKHTLNPTANPNSNAVERANGTLKQMLSTFVSQQQDNWSTYLPILAHMYRTQVSSATGFSPFRMLYGREARLPSESWIETFSKVNKVTLDEYLRQLTNALEFCWTTAADTAVRKGKRIQDDVHQQSLDAKPHTRRFVPFRVGQHFYLKAVPKRHFKSVEEERIIKLNSKLSFRYTGPHTIVKVINPVVYLANVDGKLRTVHASKLKRDAHNDDMVTDLEIPANLPLRAPPLHELTPFNRESRTMSDKLKEHQQMVQQREADISLDNLDPPQRFPQRFINQIDENDVTDLDNWDYTNEDFIDEVLRQGSHWLL
jgi:hypothetical protein